MMLVAIVSFLAGAVFATLVIAGWYAELLDELHEERRRND